MFPNLLGKIKELETKCTDLQRQIDEGGGGAEIYEIGLTIDPDSGASILSKTFKEIENAYKNGKVCIVRLFVENSADVCQYVVGLYFDTDENPQYAVFTYNNVYGCEHENDYPWS